MHDERKALRQIMAAVRLCTMQREKSELQLRHVLQKLQLAEQSLQTESVSYRRTLAQHQQFIARGVLLHPVMQEQRLLALAASRTAVANKQRMVNDARQLFQEAQSALIRAKISVDVTDKARQRVSRVVEQQAQAKELIDIFDAQYRQGGSLGV